jgi:coenzyme F420-reducing hydrogenase gamma subunit
MKVEIGGAHEFDRPPTKEEALDRLERTAGPAARKMLEQFLEQVRKVEAKYLEEQSADWCWPLGRKINADYSLPTKPPSSQATAQVYHAFLSGRISVSGQPVPFSRSWVWVD